MVRFRQRGTGLTKRPQVILEDVESWRYLAEISGFDGLTRAIERWTREVLTNAGHTIEQLSNMRDLAAIRRAAGDDSDEYFAAEALELLLNARSLIKAGDAAMAAAKAFRLGCVVTRHDIKSNEEPTWETGNKQRKYLDETRGKANRDRQRAKNDEATRLNKHAADVWRRRPDFSKNDVAKHLCKNLRPPPHYLGAGGLVVPMKAATGI
jgi:hypothetical protein